MKMKNELPVKPYGSYILIRLESEGDASRGTVVGIGCGVSGLEVGDRILVNKEGPYFEFHCPVHIIEPDRKDPHRADYAFIDYRDVMCIDNEGVLF